MLAAVALEKGLDEGCFIEVLALFTIFINPQIGEHLSDDVGHQTREDGIAGVLCGCGQDAAIEVFVDMEEVGNLIHDDAPLVETEVVNHDEEHFLTLIQSREYAPLEDVGAHHLWPSGCFRMCNPVDVVFFDETGKLCIPFALLHGLHLLHGAVGLGELQFPVHEPTIDFLPVVDGAGVVDEHPHLAEVLLVGCLCLFADNFLAVDVLLERQQDLRGIDGFDEVVGNLAPDGLIHDVLLFALGNHDDGRRGCCLLDALQGLQSADARHVLIEKDEVIGLFTTAVEGIVSVGDGIYGISFLLQEEDVRLQQVNFVVNPKQLIFCHNSSFFILHFSFFIPLVHPVLIVRFFFTFFLALFFFVSSIFRGAFLTFGHIIDVGGEVV